MGAWGPGLYQNDVSSDVKDDYISKLKAGKSDEDALQEILQEYEEQMQDEDDMLDIYLALADTLWKKGRLTEEIKQRAISLIEVDRVSKRWETDRNRKARGKVLDKLINQLNSEMPERKKIAIHKPYVLGWKEGEVYSFQIKNEISGYEEYVGWYAMFYVDKIIKKDWQVRGVYDEAAEVYFFLVEEKPESVDVLKTATRICFWRGKTQNIYRTDLNETSKRLRPKDLTCIGICSEISYPDNELKQENQKGLLFWYLCERDVLWGYNRELNYQKELVDKACN